jgi:type VI secretion system secreted protein Hcp
MIVGRGMRSLHRILAAAALALVAIGVTASPAAAAPRPTIFLKLDGIPGASADSKHQGEIEILSYSFGATNSATTTPGGGGGTGKVVFQDLHVTKHVDKASPKLFLAVTQGKHIPTAALTVERSRRGTPSYYVVVMKDILITSYQSGGNTGGAPSEEVSLAAASFEVTQP